MKERGNLTLKFLDRYLGIPIVLLLSLRKKRALLKKSGPRNTLAIKIGTIGDTLLLMPVLKAVKGENVRLTVIGTKNNREVLERCPLIDNLRVFEVSRIIRDPFYLFRFLREINSSAYDIVVDFEPWSRISAVLAHFVKTGYKAGFRTEGEMRSGVFDMAFPHRRDLHEAQNYAGLAQQLGFRVAENRADFPVSEEDKEYVEDYLRDKLGGCENLIVFHPWSSGYRGRLKEWGCVRFGELANRLVKEGYTIGITGTKDEEPGAMEIVKASTGRVFSFCGAFNLGQTAFCIKKSLLLVTVNTGIMHLGAALDHPMVALHGPAGVLRWGPVATSKTHNIESGLECAPCLNLGFDYKCTEGGCMEAIGVEEVLEKVHEALKEVSGHAEKA